MLCAIASPSSASHPGGEDVGLHRKLGRGLNNLCTWTSHSLTRGVMCVNQQRALLGGLLSCFPPHVRNLVWSHCCLYLQWTMYMYCPLAVNSWLYSSCIGGGILHCFVYTLEEDCVCIFTIGSIIGNCLNIHNSYVICCFLTSLSWQIVSWNPTSFCKVLTQLYK